MCIFSKMKFHGKKMFSCVKMLMLILNNTNFVYYILRINYFDCIKIYSVNCLTKIDTGTKYLHHRFSPNATLFFLHTAI